MANTYTPTYNLIQPEVGADTNAWGTHVNTDLGTIDTHMLSRALTTSQTAAGPMVFGQTLRVNGAVTFDSTMLVTGNTTLSGTSAHTGAATFGSTLAVTGAVTLSSTLAVTGNTTLSGTLAVAGATTLASNGLNVGSGQLNVTGGNVAMSGNLTVTGAQTFTGNTTHSGTLSVSGTTTLSSATMSGGLTIQNTAPTITMADTDNGTFSIHCNSALIGFLGTGGGWISRTDNSGNFTASGNVTAYSDISQKSDVETILGAMEMVRLMRGVRYTRVNTLEKGVGVIAQEMQKIVPEVVHDNDGILSVAYGNLTGVLIEAVKELNERLRRLEMK